MRTTSTSAPSPACSLIASSCVNAFTHPALLGPLLLALALLAVRGRVKR